MDPCTFFLKNGPKWWSMDPYFKIRTNLVVHGSLHSFLKNSYELGGPYIPISKFGPIWQSMDPWAINMGDYLFRPGKIKNLFYLAELFYFGQEKLNLFFIWPKSKKRK